ncbi:hypothetical protein ACFE04_030654 [Oxalis oulophora]
MSAYAHQMEREFSAQSLSSRSDSEMGSRYVFESGFYITSMAATIFIGGLVTTGVLLITLLVALTVMLQSCQSKSSGLVELKPFSGDHYNYCQIFAQHAEINNLKPDDFPSICRDSDFRRRQYTRDLNTSMSLIENYFNGITPSDDGLDIALLDIDDIPASSFQFTDVLMTPSNLVEEANYLKQMQTLKLYERLQASGWSLILFSRKPERQRNATRKHLVSAGYNSWSSLIMRMENEMQIETQEYFARRRALLEKEGSRIVSVISGRMDAITAIRNLHLSLRELGIHKIAVSSTFSFLDVVTTSFPPSNAEFLQPAGDTIIKPLLQFIEETNSSFLINIYPYNVYRLNSEIPLGFALFQEHPFNFRDDIITGVRYRSLFDMMVDAVISAMAVAGHENIPVVVAETGWPSCGDDTEMDANLVYAEMYLRGLVNHLKSGIGTPLRKEGVKEAYIYDLVDHCDHGKGRNWGILYRNLTNKYKIQYASSSGGGVTERGVTLILVLFILLGNMVMANMH